MKQWLLSIAFIFSVIFSADVNLSIDNFTDDGTGNLTFDIMMTNTIPVAGFQFDFLSGNGVYDGDANCRCDQADEELPPGCDECYYDYGVDKVRNNRELDTSTSGYSYGCEDSGICTDESLTSSECEDEGECSNLGDCHTYLTQADCPATTSGGICSWDSVGDDGCYLGKTSCLRIGICSDSSFNDNECDCTASNASWESSNYWIPDESYIPFNDTEDCFANVNSNDIQLRWDYYNPDGNDDNYAIVDGLTETPEDYDDDQRCYVPEFGLDYQGECLHDTDFDGVCNQGVQLLTAGHCTQFSPICVSNGEYNTESIGAGILLDWEMDCCVNTNGGEIFEPSRNKEVCEGTINFGSFINPQLSTLTDENGSSVAWEWTPYDDEATCENYGGFWYGSESGTDGNGQYDVGEYFIDADASLNLISGSGGSATAAGFFMQITDNTVMGFAFGGSEIPVSETPVSLATFTANYSDLTIGDVFELLSMSVCGKGELGDWTSNNCPNLMIFTDNPGDITDSAEEIPSNFTPSLWTVGSGISSIASDDGICSSIGGWGEDSEDDATCGEYCGDGYCNNGEAFSTCSVDCESSCGDGMCSLFEGNDDGEIETAETCLDDCSIFGCGDFICSEDETHDSCPYDCYSVYCGDGSCDTLDGETVFNCVEDCLGACGNSIPDEGENFANCPSDTESTCGDGVYDHAGVDYDLDGVFGTENEDCILDYEIVCGDGVYHYIGATIAGVTANEDGGTQCTGEDSQDCQAEFFPGAPFATSVNDESKWCEEDYSPTCGDSFYHHSGYTYEVNNYSECTTGEDTADCLIIDVVSAPGVEIGDVNDTENYCESDYVLTVGDGYCDATTDNYTDSSCEAECDAENPGTEEVCPSVCGDGFYDYSGLGGTEDETCVADYEVTQGDGYCDQANGEIVGENADCPLPVCGDGVCEVPFENFLPTNCPDDCESFCGDGLYDHSGVDLDGDGIFEGTEIGDEFDLENYCESDYGVQCGDGFYDYVGGESADGDDEGLEPDCGDYVQTCGDGYYDYSATSNEALLCYNETIWSDDFTAYINCESLCTPECEERNSCDYELVCGDGFCDPINQEWATLIEIDGVEGDNENYCEVDCVVPGCIDFTACNYSSAATTDDGSCLYACATPDGCAELDANYDCDGELLSIVLDFPIVFSLSDNYPNPFNPVTSIEYSIEKAGNVNISIYNIMGHKVVDLVSGYHSPGIRYSAVWNSNSQSNIPVSTGIYFYEMRSGDYIERKKMVLIK